MDPHPTRKVLRVCIPAGDPPGFEARGSVGYRIGGSGSGLPFGTRGWTRAEPYESEFSDNDFYDASRTWVL
jgi:hypothetical protein